MMDNMSITRATENGWGLEIIRAGQSEPGQAKTVGMGPPGRTLPCYGLLLVSAGKGWVWPEKNSSAPQPVHPGGMILLYPDIWHRYEPDRELGWHEYWILARGPWLAQLLGSPPFLSEPLPLLPDSRLLHSFVRVIDLQQTRSTGYLTEMAGETMAIVSRMSVLLTRRSIQPPPRPDLLETVSAYLEEHLAAQPDLEALAASLNVSYAHLRRLFQQSTGTSLHQYFLDLRINRAKQLLERKDLSVKQVGHAVGFEDPYYFSRVFKKRTGIAPSLWQAM